MTRTTSAFSREIYTIDKRKHQKKNPEIDKKKIKIKGRTGIVI